MEEAEGSSPSSSTLHGLAGALRCVGFTLAGFVAGEGSFCVTRRLPPYADGSIRRRFIFTCTVADRDRALLLALQHFLQHGSIADRPPARRSWQPTTTFTIGSNPAHHAATIPFADTFLLPSAKRDQFERWRTALEEHEKLHPSKIGKGPSPCSKPGCSRPVRGRGLCRSHYYRATGY
ncbi:MAG: LAGLIDADG family homing endonuclease [Acidimicrobiales bacterium]